MSTPKEDSAKLVTHYLAKVPAGAHGVFLRNALEEMIALVPDKKFATEALSRALTAYRKPRG